MSIGVIYIWNLKYDINELINEPKTDSQTENKSVIANRVGVGMEEEWTGSLVLIDANYYV